MSFNKYNLNIVILDQTLVLSWYDMEFLQRYRDFEVLFDELDKYLQRKIRDRLAQRERTRATDVEEVGYKSLTKMTVVTRGKLNLGIVSKTSQYGFRSRLPLLLSRVYSPLPKFNVSRIPRPIHSANRPLANPGSSTPNIRSAHRAPRSLSSSRIPIRRSVSAVRASHHAGKRARPYQTGSRIPILSSDHTGHQYRMQRRSRSQALTNRTTPPYTARITSMSTLKTHKSTMHMPTKNTTQNTNIQAEFRIYFAKSLQRVLLVPTQFASGPVIQFQSEIHLIDSLKIRKTKPFSKSGFQCSRSLPEAPILHASENGLNSMVRVQQHAVTCINTLPQGKEENDFDVEKVRQKKDKGLRTRIRKWFGRLFTCGKKIDIDD